MVDILALLPSNLTSVAGIANLAVSVLIAWIIVMLADKIIGHEIEAKHTLMISILSLFITPLVVGLLVQLATLPAELSVLLTLYIMPLLVWIILGEIFIKDIDVVKKFEVMIIAFVVYTIVQLFAGTYIVSFISSVI